MKPVASILLALAAAGTASAQQGRWPIKGQFDASTPPVIASGASDEWTPVPLAVRKTLLFGFLLFP